MKKCLMIVVLVMAFVALLSADIDGYAPGTVLFRTFSDFSQINVNQNGIVETEQSWFNGIAIQYNIYELKHLFSFSQNQDLQNRNVSSKPGHFCSLI